MSILRRQNFLSQERVDVPAMRSIESAVSNDFDTLFESFVTGTANSYVMRGFNILMSNAIGGAASGLQVAVDPGALLHVTSSQSGTVYLVPTGTLPQVLNAATNVIVNGAFSPSVVNYVSLEYQRMADDSTSAQSYFFDPTSQTETVENVPQAITLSYTFNITTAIPAANFLPIATVVTDSGNNVVSVADNRPLLGRLGSGGWNPNPFYTYTWPEGRTEDTSPSTSDSDDPFYGGDKAIGTLKDWMDAVMSSLQEIKGTTYWYSFNSAGSLISLREDLGNTVITGKGSIAHGVSPVDKVTPTAPGQINWDQPINIKVIGSELNYVLAANPSSTDITLTDDEVAYITLIRDVIISPNLIFTNGIPQVVSVGAVGWTTGLVPGDFIRPSSGDYTDYYQILTVDSVTQVTLTTNYAGSSTGPAGTPSLYAFGSYINAPVPSTTRNIYISTRETVPQNQNTFWLFLRTDNGGNPTVYVRFLGAELDQGEDREVSGTTSAELLKYIGSPSDSAFAPQYVSALTPGSVPQVTDITIGAASTISSNQYFYIYSSGNYRQYYVWFNKDGTGVDPMAPSSNDSIMVPITTGQTSTQVATALAAAFNTAPFLDFSATSGVGTLVVTNTSAGVANASVNFNVGAPFAVSTFQFGSGIGNYVIHDGDSLTLAIKELDQALGNLVSSLNAPDYVEDINIVASGATPPTSLNGPVSSGTLITLPNNTRLGSIPQKYTVGKGVLELFLNGQYLNLGVDWVEYGTPGSASNQFQILRTLVVFDVLELRINTGGGSAGGGEGPPGIQGPPGSPGSNSAGGPVPVSIKTSSYSVLNSDCFLAANCTSGNITFTMYPASGAGNTGRIVYFKKIDSSINTLIIIGNGTDLIDGTSSVVISEYNGALSFIDNGSGWWIF